MLFQPMKQINDEQFVFIIDLIHNFQTLTYVSNKSLTYIVASTSNFVQRWWFQTCCFGDKKFVVNWCSYILQNIINKQSNFMGDET
jgi:hypothetical protein